MKARAERQFGANFRMSAAAQVLLVGAACVVFYAPMFPALIREWYEHENFSYGFLIPIIFGYLVWQQRAAFNSPLVGPNAWGAVSVCLSLGLGLIAKILGEPFIYRLSFVLVVASAFYLFYGGYIIRRLSFPLAFLFLMVPPPYPIVKEVSYHLRMSDAWIAQNIAQALGVPVYRDGHMLQLPNITLEVADVCSGIASLFAMVALGTIYLHYLPVRARFKFLVYLGVFIFPVLANLFRIVLVTVSVYYYGPIMLQAFFHKFTGTFTFMLSVAMILWLGETLRKLYPMAEDHVFRAEFGDRNIRKEIFPAQHIAHRAAVLLTFTAIAVIALLLLRSQSAGFANSAVPTVEFNNAFSAIGPYRIKADSQPVAYNDPHAEKTLAAVYQAPAKSQIELFVGYSSRQFDENRLQSPKLVFPKGWEYTSLESVRVPISNADSIEAAGLLTKNGSQTKFVLFWYQVQGQSFAGDFRNRFELVKAWLLKGRTDGAVVRLATPVSDLESVADAESRLILFSQALYPLLKITLPR